MANQNFVAVLMGYDSDLPTMQATLDVLASLGIQYEVKITSAHRTPDATHAYVKDAEARGCSVFIAAAGLAAHLAGTVAGLTLKPVIGVPLSASLLTLALTHRSYAFEHGGLPTNERLEFLGDSVLNLIVAEYLYDRFQEAEEGTLSKLRSRLVSRTALAAGSNDICSN